MRFESASAVEMVAWQMRLDAFPRGENRARLNSLANGAPPYTNEEVEQNRISTNCNFLEFGEKIHDARRQLTTAMTGGNDFLTVDLDFGPVWRKKEWGAFITRRINKAMRGSRTYLDTVDSACAGSSLHGVGPSMWQDKQTALPKAVGIEDVYVPTNTLVSMDNLPFMLIYRQYTANQLQVLTQGKYCDPAWNKPLVKRCITWAEEQMVNLNGGVWSAELSPEKVQEFRKQNSGVYSSDCVPTIDCLDFFYYSDEGKKSGWRRRIVLDAWGSPGMSGGVQNTTDMPANNFLGTRGEFLYNSEGRVYASKLDEIVHFLFADCSAVAPFRYHSVRSLGFLLYSVCHLQNRLRCKFNDAVFEAMLQYFRVNNPADAERLTKVDLIDKGIIPEGLEFVKAGDRWEVPANLAESLMTMNQQTIQASSSSYTQDFDFDKENSQETATRTMAKVNASAAMIGSMLHKAYNQQKFQYDEICRRFCIKDSKDPLVRSFRVECLKYGIPEEALNVERWNVQPVRILGSGNKMLQVAMADKLLAIRPTLDSSAQKTVDRIYVLANSDDPSLAEQLIPDSKHISDSAHDASAGLGTILKGLPYPIQDGQNHADIAETWLHGMALLIQQIESKGGKATPDELLGLNNLAVHIQGQIQIIAQDKREKQRVKKYSDDLGKMMNLVKAYTQRLQEQQKNAQEQNGTQLDPKDAAKIKATMLTAQVDNKLRTDAHAQRTAQRQIAFQQKIRQDAEKHRVDIAKTDLEAAANIKRNRMAAFDE